MPVRTWSNRNTQALLVGMQNGPATLEDSLVVSFNILFIYVLIWLHQVLAAACGI